MKTWSTENFDQLSWHDNHVHGFSIETGKDEDGTGELTLDIDHILEWLPQKDKSYRFRVAPATLTFHLVSDFKLTIDYARPTMAMHPFSISGIEREIYVAPVGTTPSRWRIPINYPEGELSFTALGFTQALRSRPILVDSQCLEFSVRSRLISGAGKKMREARVRGRRQATS